MQPKFPEEYAKQVNLNPMKRLGDPEGDIAPVIAFLAGPDSCYFSGQSVIVDGADEDESTCRNAHARQSKHPHATGPSPRGVRCHAAACYGSAAAVRSGRA